MRIVVIGAGGIGGWLGARLAASGQQVGFLVHDRTLAALRSGGLTLRDCSGGEPGTVTARIETPLASDDPRALTEVSRTWSWSPRRSMRWSGWLLRSES